MDYITTADIARFSRMLATSFARGTPLLDVLDHMIDETDGVFHDAITNIRKDVSQGMQLNYTMKQTGGFPDLVISRVAAGEKEGTLDTTFDQIATEYEGPIDSQ
jgi:type IV pilus assembly protein PilC